MSRIGAGAETASVITGAASGSNFSTVGCSIGARQEREHAIDAVAHFLGRDVAVLLEKERDDDLRDAFGRIRAQLVDAADRVDGLLDLVGDFGFDFLRCRAGQPGDDDDRRKIDLREPVEPELREGKRADDGQRESDDRRKNWPTNGDRSEPLHDLSSERTAP